MRSNEQYPKEIKMPELNIYGVWKKITDWISHVRHLYWFILLLAFLGLFLLSTPGDKWESFCAGVKAQGPLVVLLLVFGLVSVSLIWSAAQRLDEWIFMYFNMRGRRTPWMDWLMQCFTQLGSGYFAIILAFILYLYGEHQLAYEIALGTLTLWIAVELMKVLFQRVRPYIKLSRIRIVGSRANGYSFPSGHTSQSFFMVALILHFYQAPVYFVVTLYAMAVLVGITRIYVGMHYPRDVIGGAVFGTSWGAIGMVINHYIWANGINF